MLKKITFAGVGLALLVSPLLVSADTISDLQAQIAGLLAQLKQLQEQLAQTRGANAAIDRDGAGAAPTPLYACPAFKRVLIYGVTGDDVTQLQEYLKQQGVFAGDATGFFGPATEAAVQKLQAQNGIVSSGGRATTGWGVVGPATRAWIVRWCRGLNFSASPTFGAPPLAVTFNVRGGFSTDLSKGYSVDFGDGTSGPVAVTGQRQCFAAPCESNIYGVNHTYTSTSTYVAKLMYQEPFVCDAPPGAACMMVVANPKVVGTVTIHVGTTPTPPPSCPLMQRLICPAGTHSASGPGVCQQRCEPDAVGAPSITGLEGPSTLNVGQQGTWTVRASVANNANTNLRYSVVWGDEARDAFAAIQSLASANQNTQASASFTHVYANAGVYNPVFTATNDAGSAKTSAPVIVGGGGGTDTFSASPASGPAPLTVVFRSNIVNDLNAYAIQFGDGTNGTLQNNCQLGYGACGLPTATHTYTANGSYTAQLIKSSAGGCPSNVTDPSCLGAPASREVVGTVTITVGGTTGGAFSASPTSGAAPLAVTFTTDGSGNTVDFGDGSSATVPSQSCLVLNSYPTQTRCSVSHTYTANGTYTATLRKVVGAQECYGCADTNIYETVGTVTITVGGTVSPGNFSATPKTGAPPLMVTFTGVGNYISFGDDGPTLIASGNGSLGTVTHVYRSGGEYTATSDKRSVNISVAPDRLADWGNTFGGQSASSKLCVYNNRTYQSGTSLDVPVKTCTRGALFTGPMCDNIAAVGGGTNITSQRYSCSNGQWYDPNNMPLEGELLNATSCLASDGRTVVGNGQLIAQGVGAIGSDWYSTYGNRIPMTMAMKCDNGKWFNCDAYGNNCSDAGYGQKIPAAGSVEASAGNANLANALSALESALKAFLSKLGQ